MLIIPKGGTTASSGCSSTGCLVDLNGACPRGLAVAHARETVACRSACEAFGNPAFCCSEAYNTPETCEPSAYSLFFKSACPRSYSYAYDDKTSTFTCTGADYTIIFCPLPYTRGDNSMIVELSWQLDMFGSPRLEGNSISSQLVPVLKICSLNKIAPPIPKKKMTYSFSLFPAKSHPILLNRSLGTASRWPKFGVSREVLHRQMRRFVEGQPLEGFDYEAILGECCKMLVGHMCKFSSAKRPSKLKFFLEDPLNIDTGINMACSCISCYLQHEISGNTEGISTAASSEQKYDVRWEAPQHAVITRLEPSIALLGSFYKYFINVFGLMSCISDTGRSVSG
ncbi:hypothetical protein SASPL_126228 [Salvia splendens]|uniref:Pathogenesis-related protein 5 n=1 Tax=Salvia splendens TaxID=180675 RepID=A0A8X8XJ36_SALSN|nr:hypothetical protein SASPL_126228 [Salvia splendens]